MLSLSFMGIIIWSPLCCLHTAVILPGKEQVPYKQPNLPFGYVGKDKVVPLL
jgi:hypothetical protein